MELMKTNLMFKLLLYGITSLLWGYGQNENKSLPSGDFLIADLTNSFQQYMLQGAEQKSKEIGIKLRIHSAEGNNALQTEQVEKAVLHKPYAIIINPVDPENTQSLNKLVLAKDINLVYINRYPNSLPAGTVYIGPNEYDIGILQANYLRNALQKSARVIILEGSPHSNGTIQRTRAIEEVLAKNNITITKKIVAYCQRTEAIDSIEALIVTKKNFDAIIAYNDEMAIGAIIALDAATQSSHPIIIGSGATPVALQYIEKGKLQATVFQNATLQGSIAVETAYKLALKLPVDHEIIVPLELVTAYNYQKYQ